ncbi:hypothetical protein HY384_00975 [Candidatus Daviesbacteria bacterium]|nr:hypothetical protein [Candidatus Daviesbacteria bacterium]
MSVEDKDINHLKYLVGGSFSAPGAIDRLAALVRNPDPDLLPIMTRKLTRRQDMDSLERGFRGRKRF